MNRRLAILAALALASAVLLAVDGGRRDGAVSEAVIHVGSAAAKPAALVATAAATARTGGRKSSPAEPVILRLLNRDELIPAPDEVMGGGGALFGARNWNPPAPPPAPAAAAAPPPTPTAPPLPFTFMGKAVERGEWEVYLARADQTRIAKTGAVIDDVYRVDAIAPPLMTLTYLPLNQVQTLNIGAPD